MPCWRVRAMAGARHPAMPAQRRAFCLATARRRQRRAALPRCSDRRDRFAVLGVRSSCGNRGNRVAVPGERCCGGNRGAIGTTFRRWFAAAIGANLLRRSAAVLAAAIEATLSRRYLARWVRRSTKERANGKQSSPRREDYSPGRRKGLHRLAQIRTFAISQREEFSLCTSKFESDMPSQGVGLNGGISRRCGTAPHKPPAQLTAPRFGPSGIPAAR
jgi:hypothetical protein